MSARPGRRSPQIDSLEARALLSTVSSTPRSAGTVPSALVARLDPADKSAQITGTIATGDHDVYRVSIVGNRAARLQITSEQVGGGAAPLTIVVRQRNGAVVARRAGLGAGDSLAFAARPGIAYSLDLTRPLHVAGAYQVRIQQRPGVAQKAVSPISPSVSLPTLGGIPTATVAPFQSRLVQGVASALGPVEFRLIPTASGSLAFQNLTATETLTLAILPSDLLQASQTLTIAPGESAALTVTAGSSYRVQLSVASNTLVPYLLRGSLLSTAATGSTVQII